MLHFITASGNLPFTVALAMMLLLTVLELLGYVFGASISGLLDGWFDVDLDAGDLDGSQLAGQSLAERLMGWIHFGKVPVLILLATFLVCYGIAGWIVQGSLLSVTGFMLPAWIAGPALLPIAVTGVRVFGSGLARVLPNDETQVVSQQAMVGRMATIVLGSARQGAAAQARVRDPHGQTHYVMLEPDDAGDEFHRGEQVLLIAQRGPIYRAIRNDNAALLQ